MTKTIFLIIGESGTGKDSIIDYICNKYNKKKLISYTTRPIRLNEHGTHLFVSDEEFNKLKNIVGYTEYNGYRYCATEQQVEESDFYNIDVPGIKYFKEHYHGEKRIQVIRITAPEPIRYQRMLQRKNTPEEAKERLLNDAEQFKEAKELSDITVENIHFKSCVSKIENYIFSNKEVF